MDSEEEAFNNFIEIDDETGDDFQENVAEECGSDKENHAINQTSKSKARPITQAQLDKIIAFVTGFEIVASLS